MSAEQRQQLFSNATTGSITPLRRLVTPAMARAEREEWERGPEEWQEHLRDLQQWVCELLIKNQELRMTLEKQNHQRESN